MANPLKWAAKKAKDIAGDALKFVGGNNFEKAGQLIDAIVTTPQERKEAQAELQRLELEHRRLDAEERRDLFSVTNPFRQRAGRHQQTGG